MRIVLLLLTLSLLPVADAAAQRSRFAHDSSGVIVLAELDGAEHPFVAFVRQYTDQLGLPDLRLVQPAAGDLELRLWSGFGLTGVEMLRLERRTGRWYATTFRPDGAPGDPPRLALPDSVHWATRWLHAVEAGLLTLPLTPHRTDDRVVEDGYSYVLEYQGENGYRAVGADNPAVFCSTDDTQLLHVVSALLGRTEACSPTLR